MINGPRAIKSVVAAKQRVPNADEFPVLGGSTTPPSRSPASNGHVNGHVGPTAAQVLQAPPPMRRDSSKASTSRSQTPDQGRESQSAQVRFALRFNVDIIFTSHCRDRNPSLRPLLLSLPLLRTLWLTNFLFLLLQSQMGHLMLRKKFPSQRKMAHQPASHSS